MAERVAAGDRGLAAREAAEANVLVSWRGPDNVVTTVGPFSRERAQALVKVYGRLYPDQVWIQPLAPEVEALHSGVRRSIRIPLLLGSDGRHS